MSCFCLDASYRLIFSAKGQRCYFVQVVKRGQSAEEKDTAVSLCTELFGAGVPCAAVATSIRCAHACHAPTWLHTVHPRHETRKDCSVHTPHPTATNNRAGAAVTSTTQRCFLFRKERTCSRDRCLCALIRFGRGTRTRAEAWRRVFVAFLVAAKRAHWSHDPAHDSCGPNASHAAFARIPQTHEPRTTD